MHQKRDVVLLPSTFDLPSIENASSDPDSFVAVLTFFFQDSSPLADKAYLNHIQLALLLFSRLLAAVVSHIKANDGVPRV